MDDKIHVVAIDDGYAQIKLFGDGIDGGPPVRSVFRTSARAGREGLASISGAGSINAYRTEEGEEFCISDRIAGENTQFDAFHFSGMNRVLVTHALVAAGYQGRRVRLMVGLPVADFFRAGLADRERIEAKRANLLKKVERTLGGKIEMPTIVDVHVGCQAVAAFVDFAHDDDMGTIEDVGDRNVAIVDIGGRTTDIATIVGGETIDFTNSGTLSVGALDVYKALQNELQVEMQVREALSTALLAKAVQTGKMELFGVQEDVSAMVDRAKKDVQGRIVREVERRIGNGASMRTVAFVGGGSAMFPTIVQSFPKNGRIVEDPEIANARGLWKYARVLNEQAEAQSAEAVKAA